MKDPENLPSPSLPLSLSSALIPSAPPSTYYIPSFLTPSEQSHLLTKINSVPLPTWRVLSNRRLQAHPSPLSPSSNTLLAAPLPSWLADPIIPRLLSIPLHRPEEEDDDDPTAAAAAAAAEEEHLFSRSPHGAPNHCLINEYRPGQGIHAHEDGGAYAPIVATVSLGAPVVLDVYAKKPNNKKKKEKPAGGEEEEEEEEEEAVAAALLLRPGWRICQEPGSLLVSTGEMYEGCLHGIGAVEVDEGLHGGEGGVANWDMLRQEWRERFEGEGGRWVRGTRVSLTFRDVVRVKKLGFVPGGKR
ncbi:MAG: hypothetical protein Q9185_006315 [Variospora sp. 1 TL-2023]